jgi:hypothetical protein
MAMVVAATRVPPTYQRSEDDMTKLAIEFDRIEAVNLQEGDVIIVTVPGMTTKEEVAKVKQVFSESFAGHTVLVKPNTVGFDLSRPDDGELVA